MVRAAVYARVSSSAQRENQTIEGQLRALRSYASAQGWTVVDTYVDDGRSAKAGKLDKREGFARLVADAQSGAFDVVAVVDIDRLTRTDDMRERAAILGPFQAAGIRIVTTNGGEFDLRTLLGELYVQVQAVVAAEENRKRAERTRRGQLRAAEDGRKPSGRTPFGLHYDRESRQWSLDLEAAAIVREIFARVIAGESCRAIADDLAARGVRAPARTWRHHLVWRIVLARYPVGDWTANKRKRVVVSVPPMIDESTWQRAQTAVAGAQRRGLRRTRHVYLLEGLAVCGACGSPMFIKSASGRHAARYICKARKTARLGETGCTARTPAVAEIDARVWEAVRGELEDPNLPRALADRASRRAANRRAWEGDAAKYRADLSRLANAEKAFLARYRKGLISDAALDGELVALRKERAFLEGQLATASRATDDSEKPTDPATWVAAIRSIAEQGTPEARRRVVAAIVSKVEIEDGRISLTLRIDEASSVSLVSRSSRNKSHEGRQAALRIRVVA